MFVGETGVGRIIAAHLRADEGAGIEDPTTSRALGAIDLPTIQKYLNLHYLGVARPVRPGGIDQCRQLLPPRA